MKTITLICLMGLMLLGNARAQLTATVQPGYTFATGETPTTATLNLLGEPTITISGTISGTVGLAADSVTGDELVTGLPDNITLDWNGASPRQLEIKAGGVAPTQLNTSVAGAGLSGGGGTALSVQVDGTSIGFNASSQLITVGLVGSVTAFAGASAPGGWLECDGSAVSRTTYSNLFAVIATHWGIGNGTTTFTLPDLRGEFVRGWDHGRTVDSGRAQYSTQTDSLKDHTHSVVNVVAQSAGDFAGGGFNGATVQTINTAGVNSPNNGGTETRPKNVAMLYVIKW